MSSCPSRFELTLLEVGDLSGADAARVTAHLGVCEACQRTMAEMRSRIGEYEARGEDHLGRLMARLDEEAAAPLPPRRLRTSRWIALGGLAAAAALAVGLYVVFGGEPPARSGGEIQFKGALSLEVVAKRGDRQFEVTPGSVLIEEDALRFIVTTGAPGYLDLFSLDAEGRVSPFYPESSPAADPAPLMVREAGKHVLPGSVILDDAMGEEHLVLVFSRGEFNRGEIQKKIQSSGAPLPHAVIERPEEGGDIIVERLTIRKEANLMR